MSTPSDLFDRDLRRLRRARALRRGDPFLLERAFEDMAERLDGIARPVGRLLLIGALNPAWAARLAAPGREVVTIEPGRDGDEELALAGTKPFDAVLAAGSLDTAGHLPLVLHLVRQALAPDAPFLGFMAGGDSLPSLRAALIDADRQAGAAAPRAHPRIYAPTLAGLLQHAGFDAPVVDVDRLNLSYRSLDRLVDDLRASAATNLLSARSRRPVGRAWRARLAATLELEGKRFDERLELLHWLAWSPPAPTASAAR